MAEVNQQCWLGESGQWLENVDWTHPYLVIWLVASQYYKTRLCLKLPNVSSDIYFISLCLRPHLLTLLMHQASWVTLRNTVDKVGAVSGSFVLLIGSWKITLGDLIGGEESSDLRQPTISFSLKKKLDCLTLATWYLPLVGSSWCLLMRFYKSGFGFPQSIILATLF